MIDFSVCPHDMGKGELERWKGFVDRLSESLGVKVELKPLKDFEEEKERLKDSKFFDLYYANPFSAVELYFRGYKPLAKFKNQRDRYFIFCTEIPQEGPIVVVTPLLKPIGLLTLQLDISRVEIQLCENWQEVVELVENGRAHAGIMYEDVWQSIEEERRKKFRILDRFVFESSHIFMAREGLEEGLKSFFSGQDFEPAEGILQELVKAYRDFDNFYGLWAKIRAFSLLEGLKDVGIFLCWEEGIALMNDYALSVLEYNREEIVGMNPEEVLGLILDPAHRKGFVEIVQRSIRGEQLTHSHGEITYTSKRGKKIHANTYSTTVPYVDNRYGCLVLFVDITRRKRMEALYRTLRDINLAITTSLFEDELFDRIGKGLLKNLDFKFLMILRREKQGKPELYRVYSQEENMPGIPEEALCSCKIHEDVCIEPDIKKEEEYSWLSSLGIASFCSITLNAPEERVYNLILFSAEPHFFEEENREILYELKHDLEFALQRLYNWRKASIIKSALDRSDAWLVVTDEKGIITHVNDAVCRITGYSMEELIGNSANIFKSGFHDRSFYEELWNTIRAGKEFTTIFVNRKKNGETFYVEQHIYPVELPGNVVRYVSIGKDITREVELSEEIRRLTRTDPMTGFLNRRAFENMVEEEIRQPGEKSFIFLLVDLFGTGSVNQKFGTRAGDAYVRSFAELLRGEFEDAKFIGRLYGDKFGIFLPLKEQEDVLLVEERLSKLMDKHVDVGERIPISLNAGISVYPLDGHTFAELFSKARLALNKAKSMGEGRIVITDRNIEKKSEDFIFAMKLVKTAVEQGLFTLYLQPYFEAETLEPRGFEALVRIVERDGKVYTPAYFIDYLEKSRYLQSFESWLVREAVSIASELNFKVSINLSATTLKNVSFLQTFLSMPYLSLVVEITERAILELEKEVIEILEILRKEKGVKIAMDDFGTGYSSLSQLAKFPIDILKIDMSFVRNMIDNRMIRSIVRNTIALARDLRILTLAEGVETEPQLRMLQGMGCDLVQGFLLGRPMPFREAINFLTERRGTQKVS